MMTASHIRLRLSAGALLLLALTLPLVSGCDDESLTAPEVQDDRFNSYVALGNSITAGFQSSGINQITQQESYAVLLAEQMGTPFNIPTLSPPGCPPPLQSLLPNSRGEGPGGEPLTGEDCSLRGAQTPLQVNNVAVPSASVFDALSNSPEEGATPNALTQFILGGRTQVEAAKQANPTFASVWIGNNDVLGAALNGDTTLATSSSTFKNRYETLVSELESIETLEGAVFVGVADPTLIPHFSRGAAYEEGIAMAQAADVLPPNIETQSCGMSASGAVLVPFQHGAALLQAAISLDDRDLSQKITLDCSEDRTVEEAIRQSVTDNLEDQILNQIDEPTQQISLLGLQEISALKRRVASFNQSIREEIGENHAYVNPNPLFENNSDQIPAFPELFENPDTPWSPDKPFGPLFSLDGVHPSGMAHQLVANCLISTINGQYDDVSLGQIGGQSCPI